MNSETQEGQSDMKDNGSADLRKTISTKLAGAVAAQLRRQSNLLVKGLHSFQHDEILTKTIHQQKSHSPFVLNHMMAPENQDSAVASMQDGYKHKTPFVSFLIEPGSASTMKIPRKGQRRDTIVHSKHKFQQIFRSRILEHIKVVEKNKYKTVDFSEDVLNKVAEAVTPCLRKSRSLAKTRSRSAYVGPHDHNVKSILRNSRHFSPNFMAYEPPEPSIQKKLDYFFLPYSKNKEIARKMDLELTKNCFQEGSEPNFNYKATRNWMEISKLIRQKEEAKYKDSIIYNLRRMNNQILKSREELVKETRLKRER